MPPSRVIWSGALSCAEANEAGGQRVLKGFTIISHAPSLEDMGDEAPWPSIDAMADLTLKAVIPTKRANIPPTSLQLRVDRAETSSQAFMKLLFCTDRFRPGQSMSSLALVLACPIKNATFVAFATLHGRKIRLNIAPYNNSLKSNTGAGTISRPPLTGRKSSNANLRQTKLSFSTPETLQSTAEFGLTELRPDRSQVLDVVNAAVGACASVSAVGVEKEKPDASRSTTSIKRSHTATPLRRKRDPCETLVRKAIEHNLHSRGVPRHSEEGRKIFDRALKGSLFALRNHSRAVASDLCGPEEAPMDENFVSPGYQEEADRVVSIHLAMYVAHGDGQGT